MQMRIKHQIVQQCRPLDPEPHYRMRVQGHPKARVIHPLFLHACVRI